MTQKAKLQRPEFFKLSQIQMPVGSITSILHRVTGVLLTLGLPLSLYLLQFSLQGPQGYERVARLFGHWAFKVLALLFIWAFAHHVLAGVRHLLSDIDRGVALARSAHQRMAGQPRRGRHCAAQSGCPALTRTLSGLRAWILGMPVLVAIGLFFVALLLHAWVGLRDVELDYVKPLALRVGVLTVLAFGLAGLGLWILRILLFSQH